MSTPRSKSVLAERVMLQLDGADITLPVRRNPRARRVSLRADPVGGEIVVVLPHRASLSSGESFARRQIAWIRSRLAQIPPTTPFRPGLRLHVLGETVTITHDATHRGPARRDGERLVVGGESEFVARRVRDWLIATARDEATRRAMQLAASIERRVRRVRIADPRTRWGSCAPDGRLCFSWRLVLGPPEVVDYVVAHEVAHLVHPNHGPQFWRLVDRLTSHRQLAQHWLRRSGAGLLRFGAS
jgi:predicted metal-dependent hydrolase